MLNSEDRQTFDRLVSVAEKRMRHVSRQRISLIVMGLLWFALAFGGGAVVHDKVQSIVDVAMKIPADRLGQAVSFQDLKMFTELQASLTTTKILEIICMMAFTTNSLLLIFAGVIWPSKVRRELAQLHAIQAALAHCDEAGNK